MQMFAYDTTSAEKTMDGRLGDALDVIAEHLKVMLGAALAPITTSSHPPLVLQRNAMMIRPKQQIFFSFLSKVVFVWFMNTIKWGLCVKKFNEMT